MNDWTEENIAAEQFVDFVRAMADRWGFDAATGVTVDALKAPPIDRARADVVYLLTVVILRALETYPTLKGRFGGLPPPGAWPETDA